MQMEVVHRPRALGKEHLQFAKPTRKLKRWFNMHVEALGGSWLAKVRDVGETGSAERGCVSTNDRDGTGGHLPIVGLVSFIGKCICKVCH